MYLQEIKAKSILTKSDLPGADYVINPYTGCEFGCSYCYADFMRRFTGHNKDKWGDFVDVKINAGELLEKEIRGIVKRWSTKSKEFHEILFSSVTDPYQPLEIRYKITQKCLEVLERFSDKFQVSILTKSPLVLRDKDIIKNLNATVGLTITSIDDEFSRILECKAPPSNARIETLRRLRDAGIRTYVCINPLLPHFVDKPEQFEQLIRKITLTGNKNIWFEYLNISGNKLKKIKTEIEKYNSKLNPYIDRANSQESKDKLNCLVWKLQKKYKFNIAGGGIIDHKRRVIIVRDEDKLSGVKKGWNIEHRPK